MDPTNNDPGCLEPASEESAPEPPASSDLDEAEGRLALGEELADGTVRQFPAAHLRAHRISAMIGSSIAGTIFSTLAVVISVFGNLPSAYQWTPLIPAGLILGLLAFRALAWPPIAHRHMSWSLSPLSIHLSHGVIWRTTTSVPRSRVQHTDVGQGPLQRRFGIATLSIHTAGSDMAQVNLSGLEHGDAIAVRDYLIYKAPATPVEPEDEAEDSPLVD